MRSMYLVLTMALWGCAAQPPAHVAAPVVNTHWASCSEIIQARPDTYQHFVCIDKSGLKHEVLVRPKPR